jgi:hypothetical protein
VVPQECLYSRRRLIAASQPDDLGRRAAETCNLDKIGIERGKNESIGLCIVSDRAIVRTREPEQAHLA